MSGILLYIFSFSSLAPVYFKCEQFPSTRHETINFEIPTLSDEVLEIQLFNNVR